MFKVKEKIEQVETTGEHFRKNIETQLMTSLDTKLEQIESSFNDDVAKMQAKIDQVDANNDNNRKTLEAQMVTTIESKLEQIEKEAAESRLQPQNVSSEVEIQMKKCLNDLENNIQKEILQLRENFDKLETGLNEFQTGFSEVCVRTETNQELIQSIDKELGKQLRDLASKSDFEQMKSGLKSFMYDVTQKVRTVL